MDDIPQGASNGSVSSPFNGHPQGFDSDSVHSRISASKG